MRKERDKPEGLGKLLFFWMAPDLLDTASNLYSFHRSNIFKLKD